jgi:MscS family membrane protein
MDVPYTFSVILAALLFNAFVARLLKPLIARSGSAGHIWRKAFLESLAAPLRAVVWIISLTIAVGILTREGGFTLLSKFFPPVRDVAVIAVAAWFLLRTVGRIEIGLREEAEERGQELDPTAADAIGKLVRAAIIITAILVAMQALGFSIGGLLAFGGIGGIAIGFAAQGLVANLFGGLTIYASRPFKVGEWIIMPGTEVMGEVQQIGWRATRVMGFDRRPFYVPNAMFNTAVLINHSRMTARRIQEYVHLRYSDIDKAQDIVNDVNSMLSKHPGIEHDFFVFRFDTCGDFALKLLLYAFTVTTDYEEYMRVKEDILIKISAIIREHGGKLAVPTSTVHIPDGLRIEPRSPDGDEPFTRGLVERQQMA